ncbi:hypothetical protein AN0677.2 [Paecilomyces variotii No. 5]|uniref:AN1-type domain-containing protein n=1 Tax=Byssochlamys spectabilis (strain No. 5 / NBRC 109023) TaxID=1356009 RepID=V5FZG8_BYSSN|nr:hypothetical protein AN0677.2 [Paecilomyces variotii No. 5]
MAPRKPRCNFKECKEPAQRIIGDCGFCNGHFCQKHRMLESHLCTGLEDCKRESHARNADKLNSERTTVIKGLFSATRKTYPGPAVWLGPRAADVTEAADQQARIRHESSEPSATDISNAES